MQLTYSTFTAVPEHWGASVSSGHDIHKTLPTSSLKWSRPPCKCAFSNPNNWSVTCYPCHKWHKPHNNLTLNKDVTVWGTLVTHCTVSWVCKSIFTIISWFFRNSTLGSLKGMAGVGSTAHARTHTSCLAAQWPVKSCSFECSVCRQEDWTQGITAAEHSH